MVLFPCCFFFLLQIAEIGAESNQISSIWRDNSNLQTKISNKMFMLANFLPEKQMNNYKMNICVITKSQITDVG